MPTILQCLSHVMPRRSHNFSFMDLFSNQGRPMSASHAVEGSSGCGPTSFDASSPSRLKSRASTIRTPRCASRRPRTASVYSWQSFASLYIGDFPGRPTTLLSRPGSTPLPASTYRHRVFRFYEGFETRQGFIATAFFTAGSRVILHHSARHFSSGSTTRCTC